MRSPRSKRLAPWIGILLGVVGLVVFVAWYNLFREVPQRFDSQEEAFKYGSIGNEANEGFPYWVWLVLPRMFPEYLPRPGGYEAFGLVYEDGRDTPIGMSKKTVGFPRVAINCAICHTGTYRTDPQQPPTIVPTAPTTRLDIQSYFRFFFACAADPRFTPDNVLQAIKEVTTLNPLEEALYRYVIIPRTREELLRQRDRYVWTETRPPWGPGRIDPFNPVKFHQLELLPADDKTIGNSDMEPLWNMARKAGFALHWDGLNDSLTEVILTGALGDGATNQSLPVDDLKRLEEWIQTVQPPKYPYPIDQALAARGEPIFQQRCASCHAFGGARTGKVIPLAELGTDRHRVDMWTQEAADRYNRYSAGYAWQFTRFVKQEGYVAVSLDGLWLRAPYLHNGSVPTLEDLFEPAERRPKVFYRGYDVYDRQRTGFIHQGPEAERVGFRYDTSVEGNGNAGHEGDAYGTTLSPEEKRALIEFLKTQ
jgi:processive rubber oxygenase RoxA-like protein